MVGLGSGSTVGFIVKEMAKLADKESIEFVPTSLQIKLEAEKGSLRIADEIEFQISTLFLTVQIRLIANST